MGVVWPASLQKLSFGDEFDHPTGGVLWPASLEELVVGESFELPVGGVKSSLRIFVKGYMGWYEQRHSSSDALNWIWRNA